MTLALICLLLAAPMAPLQATSADPSSQSLPSGAPGARPDEQHWRVELGPKSQPLPFLLTLIAEPAPRAWIVNGEERIEVPRVSLDAAGWVLDFPHYDSRLELRFEDPTHLEGSWKKRRGPEQVAEMEARAERDPRWRFEPLEGLSRTPEAVLGRWRLVFESDPRPAVGEFARSAAGELVGTVLTVTGDHRFLAGSFEGGRLRLSCFDGAHAFLYDLALDADDRLVGTFRSGDWWSEAVHGERAEGAQLADAFGLLSAERAPPIGLLSITDIDGVEHWLAGTEFAGAPTVIQVFGSWCPNCHDEADTLSLLSKEFAPQGVRFLGLGCELGGDPVRDSEQIRRYGARHGLDYPLCLLTSAEKGRAGAALGLDEALVAFPTTLFVGRDGRLRALHSGFSGPAAPAEHEALVADFRSRLEALLEEPAAIQLPLGAADWVAWGHTGLTYRMTPQADGMQIESIDPEGRKAARAVEGWQSGSGLGLEGQRYVLDPVAGAFVHLERPDWRLVPSGQTLTPSVWRWGDDRESLLQKARAGTALERREALLALAYVLREGAGDVLDTLLEAALESPAPADRASAYTALALLGRQDHRLLLEQAASSAANPREQSAAHHALLALQASADAQPGGVR